MTEKTVRPLSLYALTDELAELESALLESGGEITEDLEAHYADLLEMHGEKVEGYLRMIRKFEATEAGLKLERERLQAAERTMKNAAKALKDRLRDAMLRRGEAEHQTALGKVKLQTSGTRPVELLVSESALPEHFKRITVAPDLAALRHALKQGDPKAATVARFGEASYYIRVY